MSLIQRNESDIITPAEMRMNHDALAILSRHYPGHIFASDANFKQGLLTIIMPYSPREPDNSQWGYRMKLSEIDQIDEFRRQVVRAGGELLERYGLPRSKFTEDTLRRAAEHGLDKTGAKDYRPKVPKLVDWHGRPITFH